MRRSWILPLSLTLCLATARAEELVCPVSVPLAQYSSIVPLGGVWQTSMPAYDSNQGLLLVGTSAGMVSRWRLSDGSKDGELFGASEPVTWLETDPRGRFLSVATAQTGHWYLIDLVSGTGRATPVPFTAMQGGRQVPLSASQASFSPDGRLVFVDYRQIANAVFEMTESGPARLLNAHVTRLDFHRTGAMTTTFSPDSRFLVRTSVIVPAMLYHARTGRMMGHLPVTAGGSPQFLPFQEFSAEGNLLMVAKREEILVQGKPPRDRVHTQVFELRLPEEDAAESETRVVGRPVQTFIDDYGARSPQNPYFPVPLMLSRNRIALPGVDGVVTINNAITGATERKLKHGNEPVSRIISLALSRDGKTLASGAMDGRICLWNVDTYADGNCRLDGQEKPVERLYFTPDGKYLVAEFLVGRNRFGYLAINLETLRGRTLPSPAN